MSVLGRDTGPVAMLGEVVDRRRYGRYWGLTISAPDVARRSAPGQFVNVGVEVPGTLLRRPFSIAGVSLGGQVAGTFDIVLDAHGPGTNALATISPGTTLDLLGPLGNPFPMPQRRVATLLVGGGYGAAPMYYLGERLRTAGHRVNFLVGAADAQRIIDPITPKRMANQASFTTEDGSMGHRGVVTDLLAEDIAATGAEVVYACGPNGMLAAVGQVCEDLGVPCQLAVEEHMACGVGVCMTCVLPLRARNGTIHNRRVCIDGPVFSSTRIAWEASRYGSSPADRDVMGDVEPSGADPFVATGGGPAMGSGDGPVVDPQGDGTFTAGVRTVRPQGRR